MMRLIRTVLWGAGAIIAAFAISWLIYMPTSTERGVWRAQAGNMVLDIGPLAAKVYAESSHSCGTLYTFPAHLKLVELLEGAFISVSNDVLTLSLDGALEPTTFDRIAAAPPACLTPIDPTPHNVFNAMWTAMDEHYAFFDLHGVNWQARASLAPAIDAQMTDADLLAHLGDTLAGLDDGHIQIGTPFAYFTPKQRPAWLPEDSPLDRNALRNVARTQIGAQLNAVPLTSIEIASLPDGLIFLMIRDMSIDDALGQSGFDAASSAFAQIADDLDQATGVIIDIRQNPGGSDDVSLGYASHFTGAPTPIFTKTTRIGTGQTAPFTAILPAFDDTPIATPVVLLTSDMTGSAAEILTLALRDLPNVTVMGEPTSGGLSDILGFVLPNGWLFGLSNQTYRTLDGTLYESIGIPPDIAVPFVAADFEAGRDPILAAAIAHLRAN